MCGAVQAALDAAQFRVLGCHGLPEAEPLLRQGLLDACILDMDLTDVQPIRVIEQLRRLAPDCPILVYATARKWEWEEDAYLLGVTHILAKPVRGRLLQTLLERLSPVAATVPVVPSNRPPPAAKADSDLNLKAALEALRDASTVLSHSLEPAALLKQFLLMLREVIDVNRAAIFLRASFQGLDLNAELPKNGSLRPACAIGIPNELLEHFELSLDSGIGGYAHRYGRILRHGAEEVARDRAIQKEFELLGTQVAIPILDRECLVGVAVFDNQLTGEAFTNEALALIFHLLEQLGMAIKNSWLHDHLRASLGMMTGVLGQLSCGCVIVDRHLKIHFANPAAHALLRHPNEEASVTMAFSELPSPIASKVFETLKTGRDHPPFMFRPAGQTEDVYQITICAFQQAVGGAVLLLLENYTHVERAKQLEIESANLRMLQKMAQQFAHEIGNSLVPISTFQQMFQAQTKPVEFPAELVEAIAHSVNRIARLSRQMFFLSRDQPVESHAIEVKSLVQDAFKEAQVFYPHKTPALALEPLPQSCVICGEENGLKHALAELFLNAFQANPAAAETRVRILRDAATSGTHWLHIEVLDAGPGFTAETIRKAQKPFFTTRTVGVGLGLTVANKILDANKGQLTIAPNGPGQPGMVRFSLPLQDNLTLEICT